MPDAVARQGARTVHPSVEVINPQNPRAGVVLASHQMFGAAGIAFQAYQRNVFKPGTNLVTGSKVCLRIVATVRKGRTSYGSPANSDEAISLEVDGDALLGVHGVLSGGLAEYRVRIPRPQREVKTLLVRRQTERQEGPFYLSISEGQRMIGSAFRASDAWAFRMVIAYVLKRRFPELDDSLLVESHALMGRFVRGSEHGE